MNGPPPGSGHWCCAVNANRMWPYCHQPVCISSPHFLLPVLLLAMQTWSIPELTAENEKFHSIFIWKPCPFLK